MPTGPPLPSPTPFPSPFPSLSFFLILRSPPSSPFPPHPPPSQQTPLPHPDLSAVLTGPASLHLKPTNSRSEVIRTSTIRQSHPGIAKIGPNTTYGRASATAELTSDLRTLPGKLCKFPGCLNMRPVQILERDRFYPTPRIFSVTQKRRQISRETFSAKSGIYLTSFFVCSDKNVQKLLRKLSE